ncbi:hypothetical protein BV25DRAFT_1783243, partial [Artomyces pyxidatus]
DVANDIILYICAVCTLQDLCLLRSSAKRLRRVVDYYLRMSWQSTLRQYVNNALEFRSLLRDNRAVVSGSTVLEFVLRGNDSPVNWHSTDLDIYCPLTTAASIVDYLIEKESFRIVQDYSERDRTDDVEHEYDNGAIGSVTTMASPTGRKVDIIASTRNSALLPITYFWGTIVANYITADSICLAYPRLTLKGIGAVNPVRMPAPRVAACIEKYAARGFTLVDFGVGPARVRHTVYNPTPLHCPHTLRTFDDPGCLRIHFNTPGTSAPEALFPILHPMWKYGGDHCGPGCNV